MNSLNSSDYGPAKLKLKKPHLFCLYQTFTHLFTVHQKIDAAFIHVQRKQNLHFAVTL